MAKNEAVFYELRCENNKREFYARYDFAADDQWVLTRGVKKENMEPGTSFDSGKSTLNISQARMGPQYKCPYCGNRSFVQCGKCGKFTCYCGEGLFHCAYCGQEGKVSGSIEEVDGRSGRAQ